MGHESLNRTRAPFGTFAHIEWNRIAAVKLQMLALDALAAGDLVDVQDSLRAMTIPLTRISDLAAAAPPARKVKPARKETPTRVEKPWRPSNVG